MPRRIRRGVCAWAQRLGRRETFLSARKNWFARKVDVIAVDSAHGHSQRVMDAVKALKHALPDVQVLAGNVASYEGARDLIALARMA